MKILQVFFLILPPIVHPNANSPNVVKIESVLSFWKKNPPSFVSHTLTASLARYISKTQPTVQHDQIFPHPGIGLQPLKIMPSISATVLDFAATYSRCTVSYSFGVIKYLTIKLSK